MTRILVNAIIIRLLNNGYIKKYKDNISYSKLYVYWEDSKCVK